MMKHIFLLTVLTCFSCFGNLKAQEDAKSSAFTLFDSPKSVPTAPYFDEHHQEHRLSELSGNVIVLNFWKPSCRLCLIELPALDRLRNDYKDKSVRVIAVAEDKNVETIAQTLHDRRLKKMTIYYDDNEKLLHAFGGQKVPRTVLINKDGKEVGFIQGLADFDSPDLRQQIEQLF